MRNTSMISYIGAAGGIRTLKLSPADFKSAVYAVPPRPHENIIFRASGAVKKSAYRQKMCAVRKSSGLRAGGVSYGKAGSCALRRFHRDVRCARDRRERLLASFDDHLGRKQAPAFHDQHLRRVCLPLHNMGGRGAFMSAEAALVENALSYRDTFSLWLAPPPERSVGSPARL